MYARVQPQMAVTLEGRHQDRQQRLEVLPAHAIRRLPQDDQPVRHGLVGHQAQELDAHAVDLVERREVLHGHHHRTDGAAFRPGSAWR